MGKIIAIANRKGGVGKTVTTFTLAWALSDPVVERGCGMSVLAVDLDHQASLTRVFGVKPEDVSRRNMADVLIGTASMTDVLVSLTPGGELALAPGHSALAEIEPRIRSRRTLKRALEPLTEAYDIILLDCPPANDNLTDNALVAADYALIPARPNMLDLDGLTQFLRAVRATQAINPDLRILGVLLTFHEGFNLHQTVEQMMRDSGLPVMPVSIGRSVAVEEAVSSCRPITHYAPQNPQALRYRQLAEGIAEWQSQRLATTT